MDASELLGAEIGLGILKGERPTLGRAAFASGPGDLGVEDVRAVGLQVSDRISMEFRCTHSPPCMRRTQSGRIKRG